VLPLSAALYGTGSAVQPSWELMEQEKSICLCSWCSIRWCGNGSEKPEVRGGRTSLCWQPVFRLASCRETSTHWLISKVNFSSMKFMVSNETPKHKMKRPEENTLLLGHPEVIQNGFCGWPNTGQFLPFNLWGNCNRSVG